LAFAVCIDWTFGEMPPEPTAGIRLLNAELRSVWSPDCCGLYVGVLVPVLLLVEVELLSLPPTAPPNPNKLDNPVMAVFLPRHPHHHHVARFPVAHDVMAQHSLDLRSVPDRQSNRQAVILGNQS